MSRNFSKIYSLQVISDFTCGWIRERLSAFRDSTYDSLDVCAELDLEVVLLDLVTNVCNARIYSDEKGCFSQVSVLAIEPDCDLLFNNFSGIRFFCSYAYAVDCSFHNIRDSRLSLHLVNSTVQDSVRIRIIGGQEDIIFYLEFVRGWSIDA